jgi:tetratricopeptide (TPR) repeat protein
MFSYDPSRAAATLAQIESLVLGVRLDEGIPETADAWLAWSRQLRTDGRPDEAEAWLERAHERWPGHVPTLVRMAGAAYRRRDWPALERLLPPGKPLPAEREAATLHIWRAHLALHGGRSDEAVADVETALRLQGSGAIRTLAGDFFERLGDAARARREWSRALHGTSRERLATRRALFLRLARLEDRHGRPAAALRFWEAVLEIDPDHAEARRRVDDLSGFQR